MKHAINLICLVFIFFSCSNEIDSEKKDSTQDKYELVEVDFFEFRRSYQTQEDFSEEEWESFYNRDPELAYACIEGSYFYEDLVEKNIIQNKSLNLSKIDTLPDHFEYQFSKNQMFTVDLSSQFSEELETYVSELTFKNESELILVDTLEFLETPPNVTFFTTDLNEDGKQEILIVYNWYFIIGDNYDLKVYELRNVKHRR